MVVDQLLKKNFNFSKGKYTDANIINKYPEFKDTNSKYYDKNSKFHWIYVLYQNRYLKLLNSYQHKFNDYRYLFGHKSYKLKCELICEHIIMRLMFYYYVDTYKNKMKHGKKRNKADKFVLPIPKVAFILHDSDKSKNGGIVKPHFHMIFKFPTRVTPNQLSNWTGINNQNNFESTYKGRYAFENMNAYLIHDASENKHHYSPKSVHANYNYMDLYKKKHAKWSSARYENEAKKSRDLETWLVKQVQHGNLTKQDILKNSKLKYVYADNMQAINDAVQFRTEDVAEHTLQLLLAHKFSLSVFYIWGSSGTGKTGFGMKLARKIAKKYNWSIYQGSSGHPVDNYSGESIVVLDDVRGNAMTATDWTKLLDHINMSPNNARFHDKTVSARVIIMTAVEPPKRFFGYLRNTYGNEPLSQFIRRLDEICHVRYVGNNQSILLSEVRRLRKPYNLVIDKRRYRSQSGDNDEVVPVYRKTKYISNPNQNLSQNWKFAVNRKTAINDLMKIVEKKNDPKVYHKNERKGLIALGHYLDKPELVLKEEKEKTIQDYYKKERKHVKSNVASSSANSGVSSSALNSVVSSTKSSLESMSKSSASNYLPF